MKYFCSLVSTFFLSSFVAAHEKPVISERWISVTGRGEVESVPDQAVLRLGVLSTGRTATLATELNNKAIQAIFSVLSAKGIKDDDFETSRFQLSPQRQYRQGKQPLLTGYQVSNLLLVRIRDLERVGEVMQAAIDAGGNNFESLSYVLSDNTEQLEEARLKAIDDALVKAELMCEPLNVEVGKPLNIQELRQGGHAVQPRTMMEASDSLTASVPVKGPSNLTSFAEVQVKFSLK